MRQPVGGRPARLYEALKCAAARLRATPHAGNDLAWERDLAWIEGTLRAEEQRRAHRATPEYQDAQRARLRAARLRARQKREEAS